ncbi:hypothetical protein [Niabella ginsengisoli]|uniref:DUF4252 domain-containing protein n=1 Tax=Niabella ginsengisoli TaxID=522298 RepID=A0ABS9SNB0_9BACT|nr:hypothetical protein [Niabella ginsengisoli]MCH5599888.1 hypothetical protein [Niabella ginsengisoli]
MGLALSVALKAQTLSEVLNDTKASIFYYGIDFTKAKLIGDPNANPQDIVDRQFAGINALMLNEPKKYDIAGAFRRSELQSDLSFVDKRNAKIDPDELISSSTEDFNRLSEKDVTALVKAFDGGNRSGTGLLFVVDGMSKYKKAVSLWVTLFDIKKKNFINRAFRR